MAVFLIAFAGGAASFGMWIYQNRACSDCQSLDYHWQQTSAQKQQSEESQEDSGWREIAMPPTGDPLRDSLMETQLPVFNLRISPNTQAELLQMIPPWTGENSSLPDMEWPYVSAQLEYDNRLWPVKIRYRGWAWDHYRMPDKKSWRLRFPKSQLFHGMKTVNIINQRPRSVIHESYKYEIFKRHGFLLAQQKLVHMRVNDKYVGIQTFLEQPSEHFLTRHNMPVSQMYGDVRIMGRKEDRYDMKNWEVYTGDPANKQPLELLLHTLESKGQPGFKAAIADILDVDQYIALLADTAITAKYNPSSHNIRWLFDSKKGRFQIMPWYQAAEPFLFKDYFASHEDPDKRKIRPERPLYLVLNDVAHALLQEPDYLHRYQRLTWRLLNSTYHPDALRDLYDQIVAAAEPDILAGARQHVLGERRYVSNNEWKKYIQLARSFIETHDRNVRAELAESNLTAEWIKASSVKTQLPDTLGTIRLGTDSLSSPTVQKLCLTLAAPVKDSTFLTLRTPAGNTLQAVRSQDASNICFAMNDTLHADISHFIDDTVFAPGLLVMGFDFEKAVILKGQSKSYDYKLLQHSAPDEASTTPVQIRSVSAEGINSITGYPLSMSPQEVVKRSLAKPLAKEHYYRFSPQIATHETFSASPGLKQWGLAEEPLASLQKVVWKKGAPIVLDEDTIFDAETHLVIEPGTQVRLAPGKSIMIRGKLTALGTAKEPIHITSSSQEPFGAIVITNTGRRQSHLRYVTIENGSNAKLRHVSYLGALSIYAGEALMENLVFRHQRTGDALNVVYSNAKITDSVFTDNSDCIDYDFSGGEISGNVFEGCGDDAIDLSHSDTKVSGNIIRNVADKGLSIGEKSMPLIEGNTIENATTGIAVKDLSHPLIRNNTISNSETGISLYIKKPEFGPPIARLENNRLSGNKQDTRVEAGEIILESRQP